MVETDVLQEKVDALRELIAGLDVANNYPEALDYVQVLRMIESTAKSALGNAVERARMAGESWAQIGRYLGVSPQAAHERFAGQR